MSSNEQPPASAQPQQPRHVKPPFADWPTIKILTPPKGPFLPKIDEWCFTFCSQSVSGRINGREPSCRSVCIRKVFPHEVRNILSFKRHKNIGSDGKAHYPLPAEGQPANLPRALGGQSTDETDSEDHVSRPVAPGKFWDEGWYLWTGQGRMAFLERMEKMMLNLSDQQKLDRMREERKEVWHDYQEQLKNNPDYKNRPSVAPWWAPIVPPKSVVETNLPSLLVQLPPDVPAIWDWSRISKLLAPTFRVMDIFHDSIKAGEHMEFAGRVWEKAKTNEPWILARRSLAAAYEKWKKSDVAEEDDKKGSA